MDAVEAKRNLNKEELENGTRERAPVKPMDLDGKRERAPVKGAKVSDKPMRSVDPDGKPKRRPVKGVMGSGNPTLSSYSTRGGGNKDTLGTGTGEGDQAPALEAKGSGDPSTSLGGSAMDTSETLAGTRERAPVVGVMDSDIPTQSSEKKSRLGDLHLAFVMNQEVVKERAQWRRPELGEKIETYTRLGPGASVFVGGGRAVLSAWAAEECNRILGQELTEGGKRTFSDLVKTPKARELEAWEHFRVFSLVQLDTQQIDRVDTRRVLTWNQVDGVKNVNARLAAKGFQDPDLRMGNVDIAGSMSRRSSHLQVISLGAPKEWPLWSLDIKNASLQADGSDRDVLLRAPCEWNSKNSRRVWKLRAPA